jgi:methionine-rich copper-binding protein CopC
MRAARLLGWIAALTATFPSGCAAQPPASQPAEQASRSILISSSPAAGSTVSEPDELILRFDPAARLDEVTVSGPSGTIPMMVHAIGEVTDYSLPLSGLQPGSYTVNWRAIAQGREHRGTYQFTVR